MALDSTIGGTAANSYVSQAAAASYFAGRLGTTAWDTASSTDRDASLIMATARLEAENYAGMRVYINQRLQWPRFATYDRDGIMYSISEIPLVVQQATFEYALALLQEPTLLGDSGLEAFTNIKLGTLDITPRAMSAAQLPAFVKHLIAPVRIGGMGTVVARA